MGWPSVEWGLSRISSKELSEWAAILSIERDEQREADRQARQEAKRSQNKPRQHYIGGK